MLQKREQAPKCRSNEEEKNCKKPNIAVVSSDTNCRPEISEIYNWKWIAVAILVNLFGPKGQMVNSKRNI
jgi:hypothetical protein